MEMSLRLPLRLDDSSGRWEFKDQLCHTEKVHIGVVHGEVHLEIDAGPRDIDHAMLTTRILVARSIQRNSLSSLMMASVLSASGWRFWTAPPPEYVCSLPQNAEPPISWLERRKKVKETVNLL